MLNQRLEKPTKQHGGTGRREKQNKITVLGKRSRGRWRVLNVFFEMTSALRKPYAATYSGPQFISNLDTWMITESSLSMEQSVP